MWPKGSRQTKGPEIRKGLSSGNMGHAKPYSPNKRTPGGTEVKNLPAMQETQEMQVRSLVQEDPLEEEMATHFSILAGKMPWQRGLVGYSPQRHKESDMTKQLSMHAFT